MKARGTPRRKGKAGTLCTYGDPNVLSADIGTSQLAGAFSAYRAGGGRALSAESRAGDGFLWSTDCERGGDQCSIIKFISSGQQCTSGFRNCYFVSWMKNSSPVWKTAIAELGCLTGGGSGVSAEVKRFERSWAGFCGATPDSWSWQQILPRCFCWPRRLVFLPMPGTIHTRQRQKNVSK